MILLGSFGAMGLAASINAAAQTPPAASTLPAGPGRETMVRVCSTCHTPDIVAQQRLTPEGWKEVVETMANNGAVATEAELVEITAYLSGAFPPAPATGAAAPAPAPQ